MRVLVTGAQGFVGGHLLRALDDEGFEAIPTGLDGPWRRLRLPSEADARQVLTETQPDAVVHLAAVAFVPDANHNPDLAYDVNVRGTCSLLRAVRDQNPPPQFLHVSSSAVYGRVPSAEQPITEERGARPVDVYGWSKLGAEAALQAVASTCDLRWVIFRPFNHTGSGQSPEYALSNFARQIAEIEAGKRRQVVRVGDLSVRRDILDVRDVVRAYVMALKTPDFRGTYNVSSGTAYVLSDLLESLCAAASVPIEVEVEAERLRQVDIELVQGSSDALRSATGWHPEIPIEQTLRDLLESWRRTVRGDARVR